MKIAYINNKNELKGWYDTEIHTSIPTPNIEITDEQWKIAIDNNHNKVNEDGTTELFDFRTEEEITQQELEAKISEAKQYLANTDYKMTVDYFGAMTKQEQEEVIDKRAEAREFVRVNEKSMVDL